MEEVSVTEEPRGHGLPIPFSSRKMKVKWLRKVATKLEVPTTAAVCELRLMLEGKLMEMGKQPQNVQALVSQELEGGVPVLRLQDEDGVFLEVELGTETEQELEDPTTTAGVEDTSRTEESGDTAEEPEGGTDSEGGEDPESSELPLQR